jgi:hypothetical protein
MRDNGVVFSRSLFHSKLSFLPSFRFVFRLHEKRIERSRKGWKKSPSSSLKDELLPFLLYYSSFRQEILTAAAAAAMA